MATFQGTNFGDILVGTIGPDTFFPEIGGDAVDGDDGDDLLVVDYSLLNSSILTQDFVLTLGQGLIYDGFLFNYVQFSGIEHLKVTGSDFSDALEGLDGRDSLYGGADKDTLVGHGGGDLLSGGDGIDNMVGGSGNDTYVVGQTLDRVNEVALEGTDIVRSSVDFSLPANVETLVLTGRFSIDATGNVLNNSLIGNGADNLLDGGAGNDILTGGGGNDSYVVDLSDRVREGLAGGIDRVQAGVSWRLGDNLENLTLTGENSVSGTGNSLNNIIIGNSAANTLNAVGLSSSAGQRDTLIGGTGPDLFRLANSAGHFYDDGNPTSVGIFDYVHITDFSSAAGDKVQLKGHASDYVTGINPVAGITGRGIFFDSDQSGTKTAHDELIAVVRSSSIFSLTSDVTYFG